jgi:serine kinase of HPr protein (carbohydrate metabolism regulator)
MIRIHGTAVALGDDGVLLRGPSGSGKSDLALRLIDGGARLVADDQTELRDSGEAVRMSAPPSIAGQLEIRGLGIVAVPHCAAAPLRLVVDLVPPERTERLPEPAWCRYFSHEIALLALAPFEASAPAKVRAAVAALSRVAEAHVAE